MSNHRDSQKGEAAPSQPVISDRLRPPLPKRFFRDVTAGKEAPFTVLLDGRALKTPAKRPFVVPSKALADAVASEWAALDDVIDPARLPLTRIINSALDGVVDNQADVTDEVAAFGGNDLIVYRAEGPDDLIRMQEQHWDPLIAWSQEALGASLATGRGVSPLAQTETAIARIAAAVPEDPIKLAALHVMTTLTGSAIIALAHARGFLDADAAWAAAHVDEDYQIARWGKDSEAAARRKARRAEFDAASTIYRKS